MAFFFFFKSVFILAMKLLARATLPFYSYFDLHSGLILCDAKIKILMPLPLSLNCFHIAE